MSNDANLPSVSEALVTLIALSVKITYKLQSVHWNIKGPLFDSVHRRTEEFYTQTFQHQDILAERLRALGFDAPNSLEEIMGEGADVTCRLDVPNTDDMIKDLIEAHKIVSQAAKRLVKASEIDDDCVTADLATEISAFHDKAAWMFSSFL